MIVASVAAGLLSAPAVQANSRDGGESHDGFDRNRDFALGLDMSFTEARL